MRSVKNLEKARMVLCIWPGIHSLIAWSRLKVARPENTSDAREIAGSAHEARHAAAVETDGIVRIFDVNLQHRPPYIVMQYVDGGSLKARLLEGPLAIDEAVELAIRLAEALGHAHQQRIFHLDLKPANILLDKQGNPYITDFGFAIRQGHRGRYTGRATGTPYYMSPEQVRREANRFDGTTDIWSLGVILYEAFTGHRPLRSRLDG